MGFCLTFQNLSYFTKYVTLDNDTILCLEKQNNVSEKALYMRLMTITDFKLTLE